MIFTERWAVLICGAVILGSLTNDVFETIVVGAARAVLWTVIAHKNSSSSEIATKEEKR